MKWIYKMAKPRRATEKQIPIGSEITYKAENIETTFEDILDANGRFSRLGEYANRKAVLIILK